MDLRNLKKYWERPVKAEVNRLSSRQKSFKTHMKPTFNSIYGGILNSDPKFITLKKEL